MVHRSPYKIIWGSRKQNSKFEVYDSILEVNEKLLL